MVDRLRVLWNRPLHDGDRPRLFAIALALIAATAAMLTHLEAPAEPARAPKSRPAPPAPTPTATVAPTAVRSEPAAEGTRTTVKASRADVTTSKRAARHFLAGYLPYTY